MKTKEQKVESDPKRPWNFWAVLRTSSWIFPPKSIDKWHYFCPLFSAPFYVVLWVLVKNFKNTDDGSQPNESTYNPLPTCEHPFGIIMYILFITKAMTNNSLANFTPEWALLWYNPKIVDWEASPSIYVLMIGA